MSFDGACKKLHSILTGDARQSVLARLGRAKTFDLAVTQLRDQMNAHRLETTNETLRLDELVTSLDARNRKDGFHVLNDWDGKANRFNDDIIPVEVANFMIGRERDEGSDQAALSILLDYYLLYLVALVALQAWDDNESDADENLARVDDLIHELQGPMGSGQRFVDDVFTLVSIATAHFEPDDAAYDRLFVKFEGLHGQSRLKQAFVSAALLSCHLRFGFEATYGRDILELRADNAPDYPWLCFALRTLMDAYESAEAGEKDEGEGIDRQRLIEAILNGLSPDPRAFVGQVSAALEPHQEALTHFKDAFLRHKDTLLEAFERYRPSGDDYSPMSFAFNFSHNTLKAIVVDAVWRGEPWQLSLNDLFSGLPRDPALSAAKEELAKVLMAYGRASPDRFRGRLVPVITYDPRAGRRFFNATLDRLRK